MMKTVHTVAELRATLRAWRVAGERIALVPTMGNLHRGHLRLVQHAHAYAGRVVASIFVNPLQFGPGEDFERYPRTLAQDQAMLEEQDVDVLFAPTLEQMYPQGRTQLTGVQVPGVSATLEGAHRPGHFDGVATVVSILFNQVQPDVALFGQKDYQQLAVIRKMTADLHLPIELIAVPIERDGDGLALSSRNQYLSADERAKAPALYHALCTLAQTLQAGIADAQALIDAQIAALSAQGFVVDYLALRRPDLAPATASDSTLILLVAASLGRTRLIDNVSFDVNLV